MKNKYFCLLIILTAVWFPSLINAQIEAVQCYTSAGAAVAPGGTWHETYNGVEYECTCRKFGGPECVAVGPSSSNSGSRSGGSSGNFETEIAQQVLAPMIENFFNWLFSPSENTSDNNSSGNNQVYTYEPSEEELRAAEERRKKWLEQVDRVKQECTQKINEKFTDQKKTAVNDFKNRITKSEAVRNIKQLNCAAYQSIQGAKLVLQGSDFRDLQGPLEDSRTVSDFTLQESSGCPEIKYDIPEVTHTNPVGFQQTFYQTVKFKADSITVNVALLKEKEKKVKIVVEEKQKAVEEVKKNITEKAEDDKLYKDALLALNEALEEEKKVNDEIVNSEKNIEILENIRSKYDLEKEKK